MHTHAIAVALLLSLLAAPVGAQTMAVALEADLANAKVAALEDALTTAADELFADPVLGPGDVAEVGEENPQLAACRAAPCWSRVGRALDAALVLVVRAAAARDKLLISIRLVDTGTKRVVLRAQKPIGNDVLTFASDGRALLQSMRGDLPAELRASLRSAAPIAPRTAAVPPARVGLAASALPVHGWLGVKHSSLGLADAEALGLSTPLGARIDAVAPDGSAAGAGLLPGDVVIDYGGHPVRSRVDLVELVRRTPSGTVVPITVWRDRTAVVVSTRMLARGRAAAAPADAPEPGEPRTITEESFEVSDAGFSYGHRNVTEVSDPVDSTIFATWSLAGIYLRMSEEVGLSDPLVSEAYGGGASLGFRYLDPWGDFPGPDDPGGGRHCLSIGGSALLTVISLAVEADGVGPVESMEMRSTFGYLELGAMVGYTFLSFGALDPQTLEQSGWGVTLGLQVGASKSISFEEDAESTDFQKTIRPVLGLELPSYNPGTGDISTFNITGLVDPSSSSFSVILALGGSF